MRLRTLAPLALSLVAATATAGGIEDLFRRLIDQRKQAQSWVPAGALPQMAHEITTPEIRDRTDGLDLARDQVAIFVAPRCRTCDVALERLRKRGFKVEVLDLARSPTAREAFELSGARGVPTVLAGKRMLGGYSDKLFDRLIKRDFIDKTEAQRGTGA